MASKRKAESTDDAAVRKSAKMTGGKVMSFGERMLAKQGYKKGQGLGKTGEGMLNPIEVKLRPQGAGVGAVKENTAQAKVEAKRQAERRGEEYEDSSDEERNASRRRTQPKQDAYRSTGTSTLGRFARPRVEYTTTAELEASADGLHVPNTLKSLIDATGRESRLLTSTAGLMTPTPATPGAESVAQSIAKRARRDLEGFVDSWNEVTERKRFVDAEAEQAQRESDEQDDEIRKLQSITDVIDALVALDLGRPSTAAEASRKWEVVVSNLEAMQTFHHDDIAKYNLDSVAVAAIHPLFKQEMLDWSPLDRPSHLTSYLHRLHAILGIDSTTAALSGNIVSFDHPLRKSTTPYESLIHTLWLPLIRSTVTNTWDPHDPLPLLALVESWAPLLPPFVAYPLTNTLVATKLTTALQSWNPRISFSRKSKPATPLPHTWLLPWLPHLSPPHTTPHASHGLLADVRRKLRLALDTWDVTLGVLPGLSAWRDAKVLGESDIAHMLVRHLLPRLAQHLAEDFEVFPPDQDLSPLEHVLAWQAFFKAETMASLLVAQFFPKWLACLHTWLTGEDCSFEEVATWYAWWKSQVPDELNRVEAVGEEWNRGLEMLNLALDLGETAKDELPAPAARTGGASTGDVPTRLADEAKLEAPTKAKQQEEVTLKDIVEEWCAEEDLTMIPLREAHESEGLPLFRITASSTGKGGVKVFLKGEVMWVQSKRDRGVWEPLGLGEELVGRAGGR